MSEKSKGCGDLIQYKVPQVVEMRTLSVKYSVEVDEEGILNDDPVPFFGRPSERAAEMQREEDERIMRILLGLPEYPPSVVSHSPSVAVVAALSMEGDEE